jgi:hypothetical protein
MKDTPTRTSSIVEGGRGHRTRNALLAIACLVVGAAFGPTIAGAAQAVTAFISNDAAHPVPVAGSVNVGNLPATQPVAGTVSVGNLPVQDGRVKVSAPTRVLRHGVADLSSGTPATAALPAGVVITDIQLVDPGAGSRVYVFYGPGLPSPYEQNPTTVVLDQTRSDAHLESGLPSTADNPVRVWTSGGGQQEVVSWTGYEG